VQVLLDDFKNRTDLAGIEAFETLSDINSSCICAVNILNDLLCYEKLNTGLLELKREEETVKQYLDKCVSVFATQARGSGVTLTFDDGLHHDDASSIPDHFDHDVASARALQQHDMISIDKHKMDQVLRYLIANALKFTPQGGSVTVRASFVEDVQQVVQKENSVWGSHNMSNLCYLKIWGGIMGKRAVIKLMNSVMGSAWNTSSRVASYPISPHTDLDPMSGECEAVSGKLVLQITDTGVGMSEESQRKYSGPSSDFSLERLHSTGDSGISPCITKCIVDLHGGNLKVYSAGKDMGCTFTIELPMTRLAVPPHSLGTTTPLENSRVVLEGHRLSADDHDSREATTRREQYAKSTDSIRDSFRTKEDVTISDTGRHHLVGSNKRALDLLVVDDSYLNRKLLLKLMRKDGHNCEEAEDGLAAVAQVAYRMRCDIETGGQDPAFDVILMDNVMPNMDGPTATKKIRDMGYKGIIFGVTGNGED
jgi:signal transduction histidine kinase